MTELVANLHLSDHSAGCPTSPAEPLWLPDHPGLCLLAHGAQSACAVVQIAQEGRDQAGGPVGQRSEHIHALIPPVVLRLSPASAAEKAVSVVAWCSQGTESKLAAVAGATVAIFSLEQYITAIVQQTPAIQPHPGQGPTCQAQHSTSLVALSWTQEGDGLLSADAQGGIIMWKLHTTTDGTQQLTQAWIGGSSTVVQPQTILTAGPNILSPSASACPGSKHVTIWWPEELQQSGDQPAAAAPLPKDAEGSAMVAVAEQLKHPVGVVNAQWSPGSLQHGSSFTGNDQDGSPLAANAQPALMTVGYDGMIRIWVEVTLSPSLGAPGSPSRLTGPSTPTTPGTPQNLIRGHQLVGSSQFCMTLVVQPPNGTLIGFQPDSLRACWGMPCQEPLGPANRMAAGSVLWILAMVDGSQQAKAPGSKTGAQGPSDQLLLWAVEGLAGVVINGVPNNVPGTRALNTPRAVLWGQHDDLLTWPGQHTSSIAERQLACSVSLQDGTPLLHVVESCAMPEHGGITLRKYAIHSVDDDTAMVAAQRATSATAAIPPRQLPLHDFSTQAITEILTCVVAASEAEFQLMIGTSEGAIRLLQTLDAQSAELTTVKQLHSRGRVCDMACTKELGDLQRLLGTALSQAAAQDSGQEPVSPTSPVGTLINLDPSGPPLPPGMTPHNTQALLGIAQMLCDDPPQSAPSSQRGVAGDAEQGASIPGMGHIPVDWPALDEAARKAVRAVQLAVCCMHSLAASGDSQGSGMAAHQSREVLDGLMAGPRRGLPAPTSGTAEKQLTVASKDDGSWGGQVGLLMGLSSSALVWALLSENQDALLTQSINQLPVVTPKGELAPPEFGFSTSSAPTGGLWEAPLTWEAMRQVGAGFWLTDHQVVLARAEALAKAQFAGSRDAHDCALMYVALKKKQLVLSLFRGGNHKKLADFLMRDFRQDKHKDAACKNAFTLLGQHRYELAAAFFVLGGALQDAVGVCAHELGDPQLALFLARLLEGEQGTLQQALLTKELLPGAQALKDTWAECLLTWLQGQPAEALQGLMAPCEPDQATTHSSDRSITPGQLNTSPANATAPVPPLDPLLPPGAPLNAQDAHHFISQRWTLHRNRALATAPLPDANQWKKLAQQQLRVISDAGIQVNTDQAMIRLQAVHDSLSALTLVGGEEAVGVEVGGTGLFRSISGMSAMSTPRRDSILSSGAYSSASGTVFNESHRLLYVDSDRLHAVCASNAGVYGYAGADGRPFAAASVKHGIVVGEVSLVTLPTHRHSEDGQLHPTSASDASNKGTTFSAMLGDMLEAVRWPQDPTPAPGSPFSRAGSKGGKPESPTATRVRVPVGQIGTSTLAAHPTRQLFLTGCSTGEIYLCQFGETKAKAGYTPMPGHLEAPAPSPQSLFTTPPKSWNPSPGVNFTHWGQPQAVCWSDDGERFAGLGDGGVVATWRLDAPRMQASDTGYLGRSDWCHQGLSKRGMDLTYLGNGSSVLAVAGQCSQGGNIVIWDSHRPLTSGPVARLSYHMAAVTALKVLPGSQLLASADEQGNIAVKDLRMLGGSTQQPPRGSASRGLPPPTSTPSTGQVSSSSWGAYSGNAAARGLVWEVRGGHQGQGVVRMVAGLRPLADGTTGGSMLVTGGRDGTINVWSCHRGRHLQTIHKAHLTNAHSSKGRNFFTDAFRSKSSSGAPTIVTGLSLTADGLLSCGLDGYVKLHPFL
ncbi:hypothetical protein WJX82_004799 [Trebouxia sp. C0006]